MPSYRSCVSKEFIMAEAKGNWKGKSIDEEEEFLVSAFCHSSRGHRRKGKFHQGKRREKISLLGGRREGVSGCKEKEEESDVSSRVFDMLL
jgi:hypothetical protein